MNSLSWFTLDGEPKQIIPMTKEGNIPKQQNIFKAIKSTLRGLRDEDNTKNDLNGNILETIANHEETVGKKVNPSHRKKASIGLQYMHREMNKVINPDIIRQHFYETGMQNHKTSSYESQ